MFFYLYLAIVSLKLNFFNRKENADPTLSVFLKKKENSDAFVKKATTLPTVLSKKPLQILFNVSTIAPKVKRVICDVLR